MAFTVIGIIVGLLVSIGVSAVLRALTRVPQAQPGKLDVPRAEEGDAVPAIFGTVKVAPNIVWWGDVLAEPLKGPRRVFGLVGPRDTIGHRYHVGMQGALCWGQVDALVDIVVDNWALLSQFGQTTTRDFSGAAYVDVVTQVVSPSLPVTTVAGGQALTITANNLFGGKEREGGVAGTVRFYFGSSSQTANSYLATNALTPWPAYKGLCYAVWEQTYLGTVPYLKHWHFILRRCPTTLGALAGDTSLSRVDNDANPAEVLWELYTDARWGLGRSSADLDQASFLAALATLKAEGCGISGQLTAATADDVAKDILRHIDGVLGPDPETQRLRLTLIRADYVAADLPVFTASNIEKLTHVRPQMPDLLTEVKVNYRDASTRYTTRTRAAYNQALRQALGRAQGVVQEYPWFTTPTNAERAAVRDLHAHSSEFATGSMVATRAAARLAPGDPFILDVPDEGLSSVVCRATRVDYGSIHDREPVSVQWAEDVFGSQGGVYATDPDEEWQEPPGANAGQRFDVDTDFVLDATQGCLTLTITGDVSAITLVETQTQAGGQAASGWAVQPNTAPITVCVDRADAEVGRLAYRITYTAADGTDDTIEDEFEVAPRGVYAAPRIDLSIDASGNVTATVTPSGGTAAEVYLASDTADYPADATVDATTPDTAAPFVFALGALVPGATGYVKAVTIDANGRKSLYGTASISRSAAGGSGITGTRPYTIIADPPGQWTVLEGIASALTDLGDELHFHFDFRNFDEVYLTGVVLVEASGELRLQYLHPDTTWHYVDGVSGPVLPVDVAGRIEGASVTPESGALLGRTWCRLVAINGDDVDVVKVGHVALHGGPNTAIVTPPSGGGGGGGGGSGVDPTNVWDWNPIGDAYGGVTIPDANGSGDDLVIHFAGFPMWRSHGVELRHLGTYNFEYARAVSDDFTMVHSSCFMFVIMPFTWNNGGFLCGRQTENAAESSDRHMYIGKTTPTHGPVGVTVKVDGGPAVDLVSTTLFTAFERFVAGWTHDGVTLRLYINGVEEASAPCGPAAADLPGAFTVGAGEPPPSAEEGPSQGGFWASEGAVFGRVVVANRAFTADEVATLTAEFSAEYGVP